MKEKLKKLMEERDEYLKHPECPVLQEKELYSIANAIIAVSKDIEAPTEEEQKAIDWANHQIEIY